MITIRPAEREDLRDFCGHLPRQTFRAWVAEEDGVVMGWGGYYFSDAMCVVCTGNKPSMKKRDIVRGARFLMAEVGKIGMEVVAESKSAALLAHFGFEPYFGPYWRLARR